MLACAGCFDSWRRCFPMRGCPARSRDGPPIEVFSTADDLPRLVSAKLLEPGILTAHAVPPGDSVPFAAFLDGKQQSHVLQYVARGVPIIYGTVGAAIRIRNDRRMTTWRHEVTRACTRQSGSFPSHWNDALAGLGVAVVDTSAPVDAQTELVEHPFALQRRGDPSSAGGSRDRPSIGLAEQWCETVAHAAVHRRRNQRQRAAGDERLRRRRREESPHVVRGGRGAGRRVRTSRRRAHERVPGDVAQAHDRGELVSPIARSGRTRSDVGARSASRSLILRSILIRSSLAPTTRPDGFSLKSLPSRCPTRAGTAWCTAFVTAKNFCAR